MSWTGKLRFNRPASDIRVSLQPLCPKLDNRSPRDFRHSSRLSHGVSRYDLRPLRILILHSADCHLMIESPELWIERTVRAGASSITFHSEATSDPVALARRIKAAGVAAAVAIKPDTPVSELSAELLSVVDMVLVMTVEPGFGGQQLLPVAVDKVRQLRQERHFSRRIQVDGGVGLENSALVKDAGADVLVAGSSIFSASDPGDIIKLLRQQ